MRRCFARFYDDDDEAAASASASAAAAADDDGAHFAVHRNCCAVRQSAHNRMQ